MLSRSWKLALALMTLLALSGLSFADDDDWRGGRDRDDGYYNQNRESREHQKLYDRGLKDGRKDREHNRGFQIRERNWDDRYDRAAYMSGYRAGYGYGDRDGDRDDRWRRDRNNYPNNGWYGGQGGYGGYGQRGYDRQAYDTGYQDGLRHGQTDRRTRHSYRPTHDDDYHDADRGYNSSFGGKQLYKDTYRQGYQAGYDRGWNSRW